MTIITIKRKNAGKTAEKNILGATSDRTLRQPFFVYKAGSKKSVKTLLSAKNILFSEIL